MRERENRDQFFAGVFAVAGSFFKSRDGNDFRFQIHLSEGRDDILDEIKNYLRCGKIYNMKPFDGRKKSKIYRISKHRELLERLLPIMDRQVICQPPRYQDWRENFIQHWRYSNKSR